MSAFEQIAVEFAELARRVEQLESQLRTLRGEKAGPARTAFRVSEVAAMIGKKPQTVRNMIADGRLEAERMDGWWLVPASAVDALVNRRAS